MLCTDLKPSVLHLHNNFRHWCKNTVIECYDHLEEQGLLTLSCKQRGVKSRLQANRGGSRQFYTGEGEFMASAGREPNLWVWGLFSQWSPGVKAPGLGPGGEAP